MNRHLLTPLGYGPPPFSLKQRKNPFRLFSGTNQPEGSGGLDLGLAIVKEAAERHKGEVAVEPTPHGGTSFRVSIAMGL